MNFNDILDASNSHDTHITSPLYQNGHLKDVLEEICIYTHLDETNNIITLAFSNGAILRLLHHRDCSERVAIEQIIGDLQDLLFHPILLINKVENSDEKSREDSQTWTYFTLKSDIQSVYIRFSSKSTGHYSESADFDIYKPKTSQNHAHSKLLLLKGAIKHNKNTY